MLEKPELLPAQQRDYLIKTRYYWDYSDTVEQAQALTRQEKYKEAMAVLDALISRGSLVETRGNVAQLRQEVWAFAIIQDANAARENGQMEEAARLYQSVVNTDHVSTRTREQAEQSLERLKTRTEPLAEK
jgi:uncharacterized protein (UPF0147 family)